VYPGGNALGEPFRIYRRLENNRITRHEPLKPTRPTVPVHLPINALAQSATQLKKGKETDSHQARIYTFPPL
jgi:hypothetical protein